MVSVSENHSLLERNVRRPDEGVNEQEQSFWARPGDRYIQKCESAAALSVGEFESIGQAHYNNWRKSVLDAKEKLLTAPINRGEASPTKVGLFPPPLNWTHVILKWNCERRRREAPPD